MLKYLISFFNIPEQVKKSELEKKLNMSQTGILDLDCDLLHKELIGPDWKNNGYFYGKKVKTTEEILRNYSLIYQN